MKKCICSLLFMATIICTIQVSVSAIKLRTPNGMLSIYFSGSKVVCSTSCVGNNSTDELDVTMTLYEDNSYVDSWNESGLGNVTFSDEYENPVHGKMYKVVLTWSINNISQQSVFAEKYFQ